MSSPESKMDTQSQIDLKNQDISNNNVDEFYDNNNENVTTKDNNNDKINNSNNNNNNVDDNDRYECLCTNETIDIERNNQPSQLLIEDNNNMASRFGDYDDDNDNSSYHDTDSLTQIAQSNKTKNRTLSSSFQTPLIEKLVKPNHSYLINSADNTILDTTSPRRRLASQDAKHTNQRLNSSSHETEVYDQTHRKQITYSNASSSAQRQHSSFLLNAKTIMDRIKFSQRYNACKQQYERLSTIDIFDEKPAKLRMLV